MPPGGLQGVIYLSYLPGLSHVFCNNYSPIFLHLLNNSASLGNKNR